MDILKFVKSHISLLNLERQVEIDESRALRENVNPRELQRKGLCLLKLRVRSQCTGLYGRTLVSFEANRPGSDGKLTSHSITPGDIVGVNWTETNGADSELGSGIVTRATQTVITVAFDDSSDNMGFDAEGPFKLIKLANDITYKRTKSALDALPKFRSGPTSHLIDVLFGEVHPGPPLQSTSLNDDAGLKYFNLDLDESQKAAVKFALLQREVAIVHGPPGTGKTTTVVEIILQAVRTLNMKVLACAPSNIAVDNMVEKLAREKARVIRLGHPARLLSIVQQHSLDALVSSSDSTAIVRDVRKDMDHALAKIRKSKNPSEKRQLHQEVKFLRQELRKREDRAIREILTNADVVLTTTTSASPEGPLKLLKEDHFDLVVIDEVAQALEASCWIPLLRGPRCVLAGDHLQLPPTIISSKAAKQGLDITLMERLLGLLGDKAVRMLTTQYRMHEAIMKWPSQQLYQGRLQAAPSVKEHLLKDLPGVKHTEETSLPLLLIDTAGCDVYEMQVEEEVSKGNEGEADIVTAHVSTLINAGVCPSDIAVIAPYNLQVELLRQRLSTQYPALEINSVDGFQGREKEAVVITLVRSNSKGVVGFLSEDRRINVAITRARRHLAVVADSETVGHHDFLRSLTEYMSEEGEVRSALEYQDSCTVTGDVEQLQRSDAILYQKEKKPARMKSERSERKITGDSKFPPEDGLPSTANKVKKFESSDVSRSCTNHSRSQKRHSATKQFVKMSSPTNMKPRSSDGMPKNNGNVPTGAETDAAAPLPVSGVADNERARSREDLESDIKSFLIDKGREKLAFPPCLNAQERFYVHSIAEELNLEHESKGEGDERYIVVSKRNQKREENDDMLSTCPVCNKRLPTCNLQLHLLRCEQQHVVKPEAAAHKTVEAGADSKPRSAKKKKKSASLQASTLSTDEDFDSMIAAFSKLDSECAFDSCKKSVRTLGQRCRCCDKTFCLSHHIPEVHGCGLAAKVRARQESGSARPARVNLARKANLQRKMDKKLGELSEQRTRKKKQDKK